MENEVRLTKSKRSLTNLAARDDLDRSLRLRVWYLYEMLYKKSDEEHPLTTPQIVRLMQEDYGIYVHRTTVPYDIALLEAAGVKIGRIRRQAWHFYLAERRFSMPELRLLIDAVASSKFITEEKSEELITKIISMAGEPSGKKLVKRPVVTDRAKTDLEGGYDIIEAIDEAMTKNKKITFNYFDYDNQKRYVLKNDGKPYTVSPYDLIWDGDFYYLVGYCDEREAMRTFRVDRIEDIPEVTEDTMAARPADYSVKRYTKESLRMFTGSERKTVTMRFKAHAMKWVIDRFGPDVPTEPIGDDEFRLTADLYVGPTFYRWIFGFAGAAEIEGPAEVKDAYRQMLKEALEQVDE
ncbi:MAG: WYL domain-containing protein [Eubacteriaceae bacterium]|nr:WYL domain-containing protein [Eubacteriaceae bacterium]